MPYNIRLLHKRLRQSLEIARKKSSKQVDVCFPHPSDQKNTPSCEARDDEMIDSRKNETSSASNGTKEKELCQPSDALNSNTDLETIPTALSMTSDILIECFAETDEADGIKPSKSNLRSTTEQVNKLDQETDRDDSARKEGHETRKSSTGNQVTEVDGVILFTEENEENATCLAENNDMICIESSSIHTEYNLPPKVEKIEETESQSTSSMSDEQNITTWSRLVSCFGLSTEKETEASMDDDALSHFVIHNVKKDIGEGTTSRGVSDRSQKEVDAAALLIKINGVKKIIRALEMKRSKRTTTSRGKEREEDSRIAMLNSKVQAIVFTLETQVKEIISESEQLESEMANTVDDEIDSVAMEMALDGYEDILGTDTEESEDTIHRLLSRVFNCKIGRGESASFSPNCSLVSDDSESVVNEEVPFHTRKRFEI